LVREKQSASGDVDPKPLELDLTHLLDLETYLLMLSESATNLPELLKKKNPRLMVPTACGEVPLIAGSLPNAISQVPRLRVLKLGFHLLTSFEISRSWESTLTVVDLRGNYLYAFPKTLASLPHLEVLDLSQTHLRGMLETETRLPALRKLNLSSNELTGISARFVVGMPNLARLNISNNQLSTTPLELGLLPLEAVVAMVNRLTQPPQAMANQGSAALIQYLKAKAAESRASLHPLLPTAPLLPRSSVNDQGEARGATTRPELSPLRNAVLGCVIGGALGDAVGLLTEFMTADESHFNYEPPLTFSDCLRDRHRCKWMSGDFTDDTDQLICILQSVLGNKGRVDDRDFARRLLDWSNHGFPELGDTCGWGLGATIGKVITQADFLEAPAAAAKRVWEGGKSASNGSVMRTSVLGVVDFRDPEAVARNTRTIAHVTHYDPKCLASSLVVTSFVSCVLRHLEQDPQSQVTHETALRLLEDAIALGREELASLGDAEAQLAEFDLHAKAASFGDLNLEGPQHIGYTYKCMGSALVGIRMGATFEQVITELTLCGGDSDTNGAVCGALVGVSVGYRALPQRWLNRLLNREWLENQVLELCDLMAIP